MLVEVLMRFAVVLALLALAGCPSGTEGRPPSDPSAPEQCAVDADCVAAGASCCACPEYALGIDSDWARACEDVVCPPPETGACTSLVARCVVGACTLACPAVECDLVCAQGYATDAAGCLTCACAQAPGDAECAGDAGCVRVEADCCGCAEGGADTAVPVDEAAAHIEMLDCPDMPTCPGVNVCTPGVAPRCDRGTCVLDAGADPLPENACGRADLPPCPTGQVCVLNTDGEATDEGVGVCR